MVIIDTYYLVIFDKDSSVWTIYPTQEAMAAFFFVSDGLKSPPSSGDIFCCVPSVENFNPDGDFSPTSFFFHLFYGRRPLLI